MYNNFNVCLFQEDLKDAEQTTTQQQQQQDYRKSPPTPEEVQWSYTDPQGKVQGKLALLRNKNSIQALIPLFTPSPLEFPITLLKWVDIFWNRTITDIYTTGILEQVHFPTLKWPTGSVMDTSQWGFLLNEQRMRLSSHLVRNKCSIHFGYCCVVGGQ